MSLSFIFDWLLNCMDLFNEYFKRKNYRQVPQISSVIFNNPATIVIWDDGTKTVVKTQGKERYNKEKGLALCISKKALGNNGNYYEEFKKWIK